MELTLEQSIGCIVGTESDPAVLWAFIREQHRLMGEVLEEGYHGLVEAYAIGIDAAASKLMDMDPKQYRGH